MEDKTNNTGGWDIYLQKNVPLSIVSFGENETGELFVSTRNGNIYSITAQSSFAQSLSDSVISKTTTFIYPTWTLRQFKFFSFYLQR